MAMHTKEALDKLKKRELIGLLMSRQSRTEVPDKAILEEIHKITLS